MQPDPGAVAVQAAVSVVVPCYRCTQTIERAVRSVAAQTQRPAELILVDDGSPDGTGAALEELRKRFGAEWIRVIRLPQNMGPASARNAGWDAATQPYVAFLDADDAWHPRKIEIQWAWMQAHPEVALSGHASRQLNSEMAIPAVDPGTGGAVAVSRWKLYRSNPFITPSAMLRRSIQARFEPGKRYMEDYLLWLEIEAGGGKVARLPQVLAYMFKAPFGESGLSARAWEMERGELAMFATLRRTGRLNLALWLMLSVFSILKYLRRMLMLATGYSAGETASRPAMLHLAAYLVLTQSMTALLICAGFFGPGELAAEIGIVQAATLATFFAFSGNARNLILTERANVDRRAIVATRMILLLPLGAAAALLCAIVADVHLVLILLLILRRGIEWIGELHLSENELLARPAIARNSLLLQLPLLAFAMAAIVLWPKLTLWALGAWALLPAVPLLGFIASASTASFASLRTAINQLLPHFGSTASSGMSIYALRALLVLVAGKMVAGELFVAFAIGSFLGSTFANILGPSVSLHQERSGRAYLPKALWTLTTAYLLMGVALVVLHWAAPQLLAPLGRSDLFWMALGWSLIGGVVMLVAQRVRILLIGQGDGRSVFGADLLMHVYLIAAIPALYAVGRTEGLALLYLLNAALALLFYASGVRGARAPFNERVQRRMVMLTGVLVFVPLFFLITGQVFNPSYAIYDSGGVLRSLPLPVSLLACSALLLLYGRHAHAGAVLWTIFGMLFLMLVSTAVAGGNSSLDRAKMLLLLQILLPSLGLVLGIVVDPDGRHAHPLRTGIFAVIALLVPVQLAATWLEGSRTLGYSVFLFGVYQHLQFVPVIVACAYLAILPGLWAHWRMPGRTVLIVLLALIGVYVVAAHSVLGMAAVLAGTLLFGVVRALKGQRIVAALGVVAVLASFSGYFLLAVETDAFHRKFSFLFPLDDPWVSANPQSPGVRPKLAGGWDILGLPPDKHPGTEGYLIRFPMTERARQATLVMEGELFEGRLGLLMEHQGQRPNSRIGSVEAGPFKVRIPVYVERGEGSILMLQEQYPLRGAITNLRWQFPAASGNALQSQGNLTMAGAPQAVRNVAERFSDWRLFGRGILESPEALLFGHAKPLPRDQRTSAHNFYVDFTYNFGLLALLPLIALIGYTGARLWQRRAEVTGSESLLALAAVVAFLVLLESNLKVSLRQPYPGIAIYFLWGLLLARLRTTEPRAA